MLLESGADEPQTPPFGSRSLSSAVSDLLWAITVPLLSTLELILSPCSWLFGLFGLCHHLLWGSTQDSF